MPLKLLPLSRFTSAFREFLFFSTQYVPENAASKVAKKTERDEKCIAELKTQMSKCKDSKESRNSWMMMGFGGAITIAGCLAICAYKHLLISLENATSAETQNTQYDAKSDTDTKSDNTQ
jgi:hypothetical protein